MASLQKKTIKGHEYWYIVESKRINGKPTPVVIQYLGTIDNIINHFEDKPEKYTTDYKSYSHGSVTALMKIVNKIDLFGILNGHLDGKCELLMFYPLKVIISIWFCISNQFHSQETPIFLHKSCHFSQRL